MYCVHLRICCAPYRVLSLKGNKLQSQGAVDLFSSLLAVCEKGERLPCLAKVLLVDNGIDLHGPTGASGPLTCARNIRQYVWSCGVGYSVMCMCVGQGCHKGMHVRTYHALLVVLPRLLTKDPLVQEVNLGANLIGESAALEILEGLKQRKEGRHQSHVYITYAGGLSRKISDH